MIIAVNLHYERIDKNRPKDRQTKWQKKKKAEEAFTFLQLYIVGHLSKILFNNLWHTDNKTRRLFLIRVRTRILAARRRTCGHWPKKKFSAFWINLILTWIRIRILGFTFGKSGSGSSDPLQSSLREKKSKWIRSEDRSESGSGQMQ